MLTYPWKCTVLHCNHLGNTWKPLVLMTRHFDYCLSASEGDNQSVRSAAPVVSRCFPGGYNVKLYISRGRLAWWLLAFLHSGRCLVYPLLHLFKLYLCPGIWVLMKPVIIDLTADLAATPSCRLVAQFTGECKVFPKLVQYWPIAMTCTVVHTLPTRRRLHQLCY